MGPGVYTPACFLSWLSAAYAKKKECSFECEFVQPTDLVIIGTCSCGLGHGYFAHTLTNDYSPNRKFFDPFLKESKPKNVLLISECCGAYGPRFIAELQCMYPDIQWVDATTVRDYAESINPARLCEDLLCVLVKEKK